MSSGRVSTPFLMAGDPLIEDPERRAALYAKVFGTLDGRMVLADILMLGGCGRAAHEAGKDPYDTAFNSGGHALSLEIAQTAGLNIGRIGLAMIEGELETMMEPHDE
ncbi:hypothetical protein [Hyphomonas sp.]|jgi:hypothetical protein|uniref:Bbp19 family protein n=1 Tax=Hyphomonas sp. TaxID=87 RepID=UPI0032EBF6D3